MYDYLVIVAGKHAFFLPEMKDKSPLDFRFILG